MTNHPTFKAGIGGKSTVHPKPIPMPRQRPGMQRTCPMDGIPNRPIPWKGNR